MVLGGRGFAVNRNESKIQLGFCKKVFLTLGPENCLFGQCGDEADQLLFPPPDP